MTRRVTDALHILDDQVNAAQDALLEPLSPHDRAHLNELLHRLLQHHAGYRWHANDVDQPSG
jgi:hypothetical protein